MKLFDTESRAVGKQEGLSGGIWWTGEEMAKTRTQHAKGKDRDRKGKGNTHRA